MTSFYDGRNYELLPGYTRTGTYLFDSGLYGAGEGRGYMLLGSDLQMIFHAVSPDKVLLIEMSDNDIAFGVVERSAATPVQ